MAPPSNFEAAMACESLNTPLGLCLLLPSPTFEDSYDYTGPAQVIRENLVYFPSAA